MKFQITLEIGKQQLDKKQIINECMSHLMSEIQRGLAIPMNPQATSALGSANNTKQPVGFKPN